MGGPSTTCCATLHVNLASEIHDLIHGQDTGPLGEALHLPDIAAINAIERLKSVSLTDGVPPPSEILPCQQLTHGHFLEPLLTKDGPLSSHDLHSVLDLCGDRHSENPEQKINLGIMITGKGAVPASAQPESSYASHAWTRDAALVAISAAISGHSQEAATIIEALTLFYGKPDQRPRFTDFIFDGDAPRRFADGKGLPIIRAEIGEGGEMVNTPSSENWGHAQLDAIGMWLWSVFNQANEGTISYPALNEKVTLSNSTNETESILMVAVKFLERIHFWDQSDLGPWEDRSEAKRATSVGICVAALRELKILGDTLGWEKLGLVKNQDGQSDIQGFRAMVNQMIENGGKTLNERIPSNPSAIAFEADPNAQDSKNASLILLLYPFNVGLDRDQQEAILSTVYDLMGEVGFRRYWGDSYVGMDYHRQQSPSSMAPTAVRGYNEAEWSLFDPTLAAYYFDRYVKSDGHDLSALLYGNQHLKRALSNVTAHTYQYRLEGENKDMTIMPGECPEAYFVDSQKRARKEPHWMPNSNTPLNWTKAALTMALERALIATQLYEGKAAS